MPWVYAPPGRSVLRNPATGTEILSIQRESLTQVDAANLDIVTQLVRRTGSENPPFRNDIGAVGHAQCLPHVVVGNQNPDPGRLQVEDDLLQFQHRNRIYPAERLIEQ